MADNTSIYVSQKSVGAAGENTWVGLKGNRMGNLVVIDFYKQMALEGRSFNVRAGTITTPIVGDVVLTDASAEMSSDELIGWTQIPVYLNIGIRLGTGTLHEYAAKSVGAVSTAGTAFVPLPNLIGGAASAGTARASTAGGVTVAAELATTTRRHWSYSNPLAVAAGSEMTGLEWAPRMPPILTGPSCFYVQIAATTTGPSYYANFDFIELPSAAIT